jgi:cytochrome c biogenesis protein CcmG, thiol:disulfide interchange protein DsbE
MKNRIGRIVGAITLSIALITGAPASAGGGKVKVGEIAPDFTLTLVDGSQVSLATLRGKVVVLNFWATWCVPCRKELPLLDTYYALQKDAGLRVFAVTTEDSLPLYQLKKLFAAMHIPAVRRVKGPYDWIQGVPTNIIIGRDGKIRYAKAGSFDLDALNATLVPLLREPVPASVQ